ncbi:MAG TPA: glycosyltransferase family 39 protein [Terriglobales bacterium]|jgi:4-amino-4-deoxy-L-arabinose transferase-like glycosyltransferase|nr:glycosyltransferase family 39 protein [Terriglobales bacterium]
MENPRRYATDWLLLAGFCAFLFFFGLAYFGLTGPDEPRYAQVAREMLARHDWITPVLGGKPWLEKPVLYYWQAMVVYSVFGVSDWAARLPSAIDATLMVIAVYLFLCRFRSRMRLDGALMTASAAGIIAFARAASMDMALAASFTIALLGWFAWHEIGEKKYLAVFYGFLGVGTLAKGPVAPALAAVIVILFAGAKGEWSLLKRTLWLPGILVFFAVALPWYIAVQIRTPEFFRVFILEHNLARFGTNLYRHHQPFWYYLPVVLLELVPWIVLTVAAVVEIARGWWTEKRELARSEDAFSVFLFIWLLIPVLFFSISRSKLPGYILPALPAGALLVTEFLRRHIDEHPGAILTAVHALVAAVPVVPALMIQYILFQHHLPLGQATLISSGFAIALAAGIFFTLRSQPGWKVLRFVTLIPVAVAVAALLRIGAPAVDSSLSTRPLATQIQRMENGVLPTAVFKVTRQTEYGLAFYRNQTISRYETGEIPAVEHVVVAPIGSETAIKGLTAGRRVSYLGTYEPQSLDYYWVASAEK